MPQVPISADDALAMTQQSQNYTAGLLADVYIGIAGRATDGKISFNTDVPTNSLTAVVADLQNKGYNVSPGTAANGKTAISIGW